MNETKNGGLTENSKELRKNMTEEEKHLWYDFLKKQGTTINRQKVIGKYIVDFYCASSRTVIEIDGSQHYKEEGREKDKERDAYLNSLGITVLRYSNRDINNNFSGVCKDIQKHIHKEEK